MGKKCKRIKYNTQIHFTFLTKTALQVKQVNHMLFMLHDLDKCQYLFHKIISQFQFINRKILSYNRCGTKSHTVLNCTLNVLYCRSVYLHPGVFYHTSK